MVHIKNILTLLIIFTISSYSSKESHKIASIPEASGISFCKNSNSLVVANDEGYLYEIDTSGREISKKKLGDYDLEGVVCRDREFIFAVENGTLLRVDRDSFKLKLVKIEGIKRVKLTKKGGIEGIARVGKRYYLTTQSKSSKKGAKFIIIDLKGDRAVVKDIKRHGIIDSAGMEYHKGKLYIVSDKRDRLYIYNIKKGRVAKRKIKLDKFAQEGITFDSDGNIYFADDNGAVFKYSKYEYR